MIEIRTTEIGTVFDWSIVECIFRHLYVNHEIDSYICIDRTEDTEKNYTPKLLTDIALEKQTSLEKLTKDLICYILPDQDPTQSQTILLRQSLIKAEKRIFRTFIIIRM